MATRPLTPRQERFVQEYLIDLNATAAAGRAGYKDPNKGRQLVTKSNVAEAIAAAKAKRAQRVELTQDWVLGRLEIESLREGEGSSPSARVKALELLGRHQGMWPNKIEVENRGTLRIKKVIIHAADRDGHGANGRAAREAGGVLPE